MPPLLPPAAAAHVRYVHSFHELVTTTFTGQINALCWPRTLPGDFAEVVHHLGTTTTDLAPLDAPLLASLPLSPAGRAAVAILCEDLRLLHEHGLQPTLDLIHAYPRDETPSLVPTDVYSFHADRASVPADTYLCTYHGPTSQGLPNAQVQQKVTLPTIRAALLECYGGPDGDEFRTFLAEHSYDLHYAPTAQAQPYDFGQGNLWRIAIEYPGCPVPPCIHRAPTTAPGQTRLLLIS